MNQVQRKSKTAFLHPTLVNATVATQVERHQEFGRPVERDWITAERGGATAKAIRLDQASKLNRLLKRYLDLPSEFFLGFQPGDPERKVHGRYFDLALGARTLPTRTGSTLLRGGHGVVFDAPKHDHGSADAVARGVLTCPRLLVALVRT